MAMQTAAVILLRAPNDKNGNSRRRYIIVNTDVIECSTETHYVDPDDFSWRDDKILGTTYVSMCINISASEYKSIKKDGIRTL